ncbi:hypothetical protein CDAR_535531 [Caerostris darwini]|uniref:Uncharacterized protein n=1 Tax=Caerostris darwini TaxID=1538125 RepID=A0AAV4QSP4_9ARAC|nr:hypothetical protein CDAR_535531 [Caerostris darwini]
MTDRHPCIDHLVFPGGCHQPCGSISSIVTTISISLTKVFGARNEYIENAFISNRVIGSRILNNGMRVMNSSPTNLFPDMESSHFSSSALVILLEPTFSELERTSLLFLLDLVLEWLSCKWLSSSTLPMLPSLEPRDMTPQFSMPELLVLEGAAPIGATSLIGLANGLIADNGLIGNGLIAHRVVGNGILANGLIGNGLIANRVLGNGIIANGLIAGHGNPAPHAIGNDLLGAPYGLGVGKVDISAPLGLGKDTL